MPHLAGKKVAKSHSTIIGEAKSLLKSALKSGLVDKVVTGEIKVIGSGPLRLKITPVPAGLKLMVRGRGARQQIFLYTKKPNELVDLLEKS
jgi:hypothetical protein